MKILIADDDRDVREMLRMALTRLGHVTRTVARGDEAVSAALKDPPDALVLDCRMPGLDGVDSAYQLRKLDIPTLFISGDPACCAHLQGSSAEFLAKPFTILEFVARVEALAA